ncbi:MAG TPA: Ig-like domain-containing protein, partial [Actinomycetota bacterium]|nr:Ig-like domain-containing protein [Actinomycetota bacterium]
PAQGVAAPYPSGALDETRDAHNGTVVVPPDSRTAAPVDEIVGFRYDAGRWIEIPVQVDERYPYFLANGRSDFGIYSGTDFELTYAWDDENWMKTAGLCRAEYPEGRAPVPDPVPGLDDDDEIVFMASDAGAMAPDGTPGPPGTQEVRQMITIADPLDPAATRFVYLFRRPGGPGFDANNGYVTYTRDANADDWIDRGSFADSDPEKLGSSNTPYGPNIPGTVCDPDGTVRQSSDRFPRDGVTVTTAKYRWRATGRWMVREMHVAKPGQPGAYGPDLIDRWKGRAFQQSPDSSISVVGFEDEQVNWEANSALLGELKGPVRAIREVWGADSGTNVTKTETFYRDAIVYRYHLRVHPIPPDGLYTSWDYNRGVASTYFNAVKPDGVPIDGMNDDVGNVDDIGGTPAYFDAPDPTFNLPSAYYTWEQVSGAGDSGSLAYTFELKGATSATNPAAVPYYRDDKCLDDGTGDDPVPRPWPGEASTDQRVRDGYAAMAGEPYEQVTCDERQGAWASHGVHIFATQDTDNAWAPMPTTEIDAQQWQWAIPTSEPKPVGEPYVQTVRAPLRTIVQEQANPERIEPERQATTLSISVPPRREWKGDGRMTATLTTRAGEPIGGAAVRFLVNGAPHHTATTDANGKAVAPTGSDFDDQTRIRVVFDGSAEHEPSAVEVAYHPGRGASGTSG